VTFHDVIITETNREKLHILMRIDKLRVNINSGLVRHNIFIQTDSLTILLVNLSVTLTVVILSTSKLCLSITRPNFTGVITLQGNLFINLTFFLDYLEY